MVVLRRRRRWGRTDGRTYGGCAIRGVRVRSGGARSSARERFGTVSPAMEKRVELEKRGRNPGEVRQTFDYYFIFASGLLLPPIFISLSHSLSSPPLPLSLCCASSLPMCISLVYTLSLSLFLFLSFSLSLCDSHALLYYVHRKTHAFTRCSRSRSRRVPLPRDDVRRRRCHRRHRDRVSSLSASLLRRVASRCCRL